MERKSILEKVSSCDIMYHILGKTDRSAMPIGNGELAASVWVNKEGEICFYLSRSDALTELDRTVKLGMFVIRITPGQFTDKSFSQRLLLAEGRVRITGQEGWVDLWIDSERDIFYIKGHFPEGVDAEMEYINWRTDRNTLAAEALGYSTAAESADIIVRQESRILFYHKNEGSVIREAAQLQGLEDCMDVIPDLLTGRIFGGMAVLSPANGNFCVKIATQSGQMEEDRFINRLEEMLDQCGGDEQSRERTGKHWNDYWCKSYIFVENDEENPGHYRKELEEYIEEPMEYQCAMKSPVTRAYLLTKYMHACCNSGAFPVLYNGMLFSLCAAKNQHFTVDNFGAAYTGVPGEFSLEYNPDERSWCVEQLWQNIRHPYYSLLERGEGEKLKILFRYYRRFWELNRIRAKRYYEASGQHNTEMTLSCGLQSPGIYGRERAGKPPGYAANRWGGAVDISPGLELSCLMLDYYDFYKDEEFLKESLIFIRDLLLYIETRFPSLQDGKMQIGPINAVETYRDTVNPVPVVAGLRYVIRRILKIGRKGIPDLDYFKNYMEKLPQLSFSAGTAPVLLPAEQYLETRYNVEVVELYACYPFREYTFYKKDLQTARRTYFHRTAEYGIRRCFVIGETPSSPSYSGWQNIGTVAAVLGLEQEAAQILMNNCSLQNPGTRFPAMWGPVYDAVPDTDHGANILNQLQKMVMQTEDGKIYLAPALPKEWKVEFRLYADANTCVEGVYADGRIEQKTISSI